MLVLNCTKKLLGELEITDDNFIEKEALLDSKDDFYNWHANLVRYNRRKCVLLMNADCRYSILLYGLKKPDFKKLDELCLKAIRKNFLADRISQRWIERYFSEIDKIKFSKTFSRSVLASMNSITQNAGFLISKLEFPEMEGKNLTRINKKLNRIPVLTGDFGYPVESIYRKMRTNFGPAEEPEIYQFRITLSRINPPIWRRIQIPGNHTFWDLHMAIQDTMEWKNYHLFEFRVPDDWVEWNNLGNNQQAQINEKKITDNTPAADRDSLMIEDLKEAGEDELLELFLQNRDDKYVEIGLPQFAIDYDTEIIPSWEARISHYFRSNNNLAENDENTGSDRRKTADYVYDYGDNWVHEVELEKILPADVRENLDKDESAGVKRGASGVKRGVYRGTGKYLRCLGGERAGPPEDCGGVGGYERLIEALADPGDPEHEDMRRWAGRDYDPEYFDCAVVEFTDPDKALFLGFYH